MLGKYVFVACFLLGCSTKQEPVSLPKTAMRGVSVEAVQPLRIHLSWEDANIQPVSWNIYSAETPQLGSMRFVTNVSEKQVSFPITKEFEFFGVRARRGTNESGWATK